MAARRERGLLDPDAAPGESPLRPPRLRASRSDGDLQEGVSSEASLDRRHAGARQPHGHLRRQPDLDRGRHRHRVHRGRRRKRYEAYGWHVQTVDWTNGDARHDYVEDVPALYEAIKAADAVTDKPSLIVLRTIIAWPAPNAQNTEKAHGSRARRRRGRRHQEGPRLRPGADLRGAGRRPRSTPGRCATRGKAVGRRVGRAVRRLVGGAPGAGRAAAPAEGARAARRARGRRSRPSRPTPRASPPASASGQVINAIAPLMPELWGGSADLAGSNNTTIEGAPSFLPPDRSVEEWKADPYQGRVLHFGIREHGMGAIMNGIAVHGGTRVFGGTFLTFSDYMRGAVRVAALMQAAGHLRLDPRLDRPRRGRADAPAGRAPRGAAGDPRARHRPPRRRQRDRRVLAADPQEHRPPRRRSSSPGRTSRSSRAARTGSPDTTDVAPGGYVLVEADGGQPDVILIGTGSEVQLAVEARELLAADGIDARVVSMPSSSGSSSRRQAYRDDGHPADREGAGLRRGRHPAGLARVRRRRRPDGVASSATAPPPTAPGSSRSSASPPSRRQAAKDSIEPRPADPAPASNEGEPP